MDRDITPELSVGTYIDFNVKFLLTFGCAFELPLVLTILARVGVVIRAAARQISQACHSQCLDHLRHRHAGCHAFHHDADGRAVDGAV